MKNIFLRTIQGIYFVKVKIYRPNIYKIMSPYKFTSKTHSLSTEDLEKNFIDWFIHSFTFQHCGNILL